ncbi:MAG: hypothetical protein M1829_006453 [Trizodia sp. TS-e1964]|nr:MAG: hypothetical protein M1829_006453 [Trizodia sp. TS-e1964]
MSDGRILKPDKDFTKDVDRLLPEAETLAKSNIQGALEKLYFLEKQARQASDLSSTSRLLIAIVSICKEAGDWSLLNEQVLLTSKKHGQLKQAITKMVQVVMGFLEDTPNLDTKLSVIESLRTVTEGKIFVEVERARVTRILSEIKREQGELKASADILCELQVETFGSMERREKTEFILQQISLCIEVGDWTQASILSRKISTKYFTRRPKKTPEEHEKERLAEEGKKKKQGADYVEPEKADDTTDLKLKYYDLQIILGKHDKKYLDVCKHWRQVLDTEAVEENPEKLRTALQRVIFYIVLSPYDNEQSDLLQRIFRDTRNLEIPTDLELLKLFTIPELMPWPHVSERFSEHLCSTDVFDSNPKAKDNSAYVRWQDLRNRVIEHNVRVVAKYYTRIEIKRLTELLDLSDSETEKYISKLVTAKTVYAKIDRPAGVVCFTKKPLTDDVLNGWSSDMKSLLGLLERIDHLITKEEMMAMITPKVEKAKATAS